MEGPALRRLDKQREGGVHFVKKSLRGHRTVAGVPIKPIDKVVDSRWMEPKPSSCHA